MVGASSQRTRHRALVLRAAAEFWVSPKMWHQASPAPARRTRDGLLRAHTALGVVDLTALGCQKSPPRSYGTRKVRPRPRSRSPPSPPLRHQTSSDPAVRARDGPHPPRRTSGRSGVLRLHPAAAVFGDRRRHSLAMPTASGGHRSPSRAAVSACANPKAEPAGPGDRFGWWSACGPRPILKVVRAGRDAPCRVQAPREWPGPFRASVAAGCRPWVAGMRAPAPPPRAWPDRGAPPP